MRLRSSVQPGGVWSEPDAFDAREVDGTSRNGASSSYKAWRQTTQDVVRGDARLSGSGLESVVASLLRASRGLHAPLVVAACRLERESAADIAARIARLAMETELRVLLVELDRFATVALDDKPPAADLAASGVTIADTVLLPFERTESSGLAVLSADGEWPCKQWIRQGTLSANLRAAAQQFDLILIDAGPDTPATHGWIAAGADGAIIIVRKDHTPLSALRETCAVLASGDVPVLATLLVN